MVRLRVKGERLSRGCNCRENTIAKLKHELRQIHGFYQEDTQRRNQHVRAIATNRRTVSYEVRGLNSPGHTLSYRRRTTYPRWRCRASSTISTKTSTKSRSTRGMGEVGVAAGHQSNGRRSRFSAPYPAAHPRSTRPQPGPHGFDLPTLVMSLIPDGGDDFELGSLP